MMWIISAILRYKFPNIIYILELLALFMIPLILMGKDKIILFYHLAINFIHKKFRGRHESN